MKRAAWSCLALLLSWPLAASAEQASGPARPAPAPAAPLAAPPSLPESAQPTSADVERAKESFKAGAAAYAAGQYQAAIQALDAAYGLAPLPAIAFSLAQAERRQYFVERRPQHLLRSIALFRRYVEQVPSGGRRADALDALSQLEPLAARLDGSAHAALPSRESPGRSTRLMVISEAPGARIWIDGVELSASPLIREVTAGKHRVRVQAPGFLDSERDVEAVAGELIPISMPLAEQPSRLEVTAPDDAELYVDGAFVSLGGQRVVLQLPSGRHRVSVAENGHRLAVKNLELARGGRQKVVFTLEPTTQRLTSHVLLIVGAASLAGGVALSVLAVQSEDAAQAFLEKSQTGNVSNAELVRYDADVTRRNRYRMMAGVGFGASLGLVVTSLFLHELDQPRPEDLNRAGFDISALLGDGQLGASVQGTF